ncbi:MAG: F0F1 ATP synthase subunit A [Alphaproteobacteria bacterium]|nr:F0F1 ATP synthase subunit A [Alphaproteobacteria bacterium]
MANPIQQFEISPIIPLSLGSLDISYTNSSLWMTIAVVLSTVFLTLAMRHKKMVPGRVQVFAEMTYEFVAGMIRDNIGPKGQQYFPLIFTLFMVVLLGNILGLVPYSFTYTSHIIVTAVLAFVIFFTVLCIGFYKHGLHFLELFVPPGMPLWLTPLIVPIEVLSFFIRPVTLSVRLFANMIAGHIMLKVFAGFSAGMVAMGLGGVAFGILPMLFNTVLIGFELLIAFLQAYVFAVLSCIYLKDTVEIGH